MISVQLDPTQGDVNQVQIEFFNMVMMAVNRHRRLQKKMKELNECDPTNKKEFNKLSKEIEELENQMENDLRIFWIGGSIRGGKTVITMTIIIILLKMYPGAKAHIIRGTMPKLKSNAIPSFERILGNNPNVYWKRSNDDYFCQFPNGSRVYFLAENYAQDKNHTKFLGLETNFILLEQAEEITESGYNIMLSRLGSWHGIDGIKPPAIMMASFNPSVTWVDKKIVKNALRGKLLPPHSYTQALSTDNPFNTKEQWNAWKQLDEETYKTMILGESDLKLSDIFLSSFNETKNVGDCSELLFGYPIVISFDFNVDPMTCVIGQTDGSTFIHFTHSFAIKDSDTHELCEYIKPIIRNREHEVIITGDASGMNRMSGVRGHINHYSIIQELLGLKNEQFDVPSANPNISDSRVFCNSVFSRFPKCIIDKSLTDLIEDVQFTQIKRNGRGKIEIAKTGVNAYTQKDNSLHGHNLDNIRYFLHSQVYSWFEKVAENINS